jgi:enamine deaminase RidA (YjgF/YER057c/UK114 family)
MSSVEPIRSSALTDAAPYAHAAVVPAGLADVAKSTVYVASSDRAELVAAWDVVRAAFGEHDAPSTLLGVAMLGYPDQLVEVEVEASPSCLPTRVRCAQDCQDFQSAA